MNKKFADENCKLKALLKCRDERISQMNKKLEETFKEYVKAV